MSYAINNLVIAVMGAGGLVIGKKSKTHDGWTLTTPVAIVIQQTPRGAEIMLTDIIGKPSEMVLPAIWWAVEDDTITNLYVQATTGLVLPKLLPGEKFMP